MPGGVRRYDGREPTLGGGERFTELELGEILRWAAERQEGLTTESDGRFSLAEIQQIAAEVGIAPAHVAAAAVEVTHRSPPPQPSALGAPTSFRFERWLDGEIPRSAIGELFDIARREIGLQGQVSEALDTVEWRARSNLAASVVSVATRSGRTKISVYLAPTDVAALVGLGTSFGGLGAAVGIGLALGTTAAVAGPLAIAATVAVSLGWAGVGSWVAMRGIWRRLARRWEERAKARNAARGRCPARNRRRAYWHRVAHRHQRGRHAEGKCAAAPFGSRGAIHRGVDRARRRPTGVRLGARGEGARDP